jgi:hypothetical protein
VVFGKKQPEQDMVSEPESRHNSVGRSDSRLELGVLIAVIESLQQLKQYHDNWINYRSTEEALKHEQYLYLARAGPYRGVDSPQTLLAERVEAIVSQEEKGWVSTQTAAEQSKPAT